MSARASRSKSIASTFSSTSVMLCSAGVSAASSGRQAVGRLARLCSSGSACSKPQYEILEPRIDQHNFGHRSPCRSMSGRTPFAAPCRRRPERRGFYPIGGQPARRRCEGYEFAGAGSQGA